MKKQGLKIIIATAALFFLGSCGFTPVYGVNGAGIGAVSVAPIEGRIGYFLGQSLQRRAGLENASSDKRNLEIKIKQKFNNVSLRSDSFASRTRVTIDAEYTLSETTTQAPISGSVTSVVSFDSVEQAFSDVSLQADAEERAANDLADRIWADIINKSRAKKR